MSVIPVLLYHSVADHPPRDERRYSVSCADFDAHADAIRDSGRSALLITELAAALRGDRPLPDRPVAITFDDGCEGTFEAVEALGGRGLTSTVYVTTGEAGTPGRLTLSELTALAELPYVELGAHAVAHRRLDQLDDGELTGEVRLSRSWLEELLQAPIRSFAYPHGAYDRRVRSAVIDAGYSSAAAVKNALSHAGDDPFAIARWTVINGTPASRIAEVLEGKAVPLAWRRERLRTRAYRTARRRRYRLARSLGVGR